MENRINAYLDDLNIVRVYIPKYDFNKSLEYFFISDINNIQIYPYSYKELDLEYELTFLLSFNVDILEDSFIKTSSNLNTPIKNRYVSKCELFDKLYSTSEMLGAIYNKDYTIFNLWSPYSKDVSIILYDLNNKESEYKLTKENNRFTLKLDGDYLNYKYKFKTIINNETIEVIDPYSYAIDEINNLSIVVDINKFKVNKFNLKKYNPIIYETSIRDFTSFYKNEITRSSFGYFTKAPSFEYLKDLGINYIEFLPINLFGGIDNINRLKEYNWGYNPINYFSLTSEYSISDNPINRINEFKELVNTLHKNNINVIMDVVYNHVYKHYLFEYEKLVPYYSFIYDKDYNLSDYSGCSNDLDTSRKMIKRLIIDSLTYLVNTFDVDGFRFDLMGLINKDTINEVVNTLSLLKKDLIFFGEGWEMGDYPKYSQATINNPLLDIKVGFFNDYYRETIKRYILGNSINIDELNNTIKRSINYSVNFNDIKRSINYLECHDDYALIDYIKLNNKDYIKDRSLLGISLILLSLGTPFIHSGMEFFNSKKLEKNTYNMGDSYNMVDFSLLKKEEDSINFIKELIKYRKDNKIYDINDSVNYYNLYYQNNILVIENNIDNDIIYIFNNYDKYNINIDISKIKLKSPSIIVNNSYIEGLGIIILKK